VTLLVPLLVHGLNRKLQDRAAEIGIEGRSKMGKDELIDALREH
jgi:hypothetical protein